MRIRGRSWTEQPARPVLITERWFRADDLPAVRAVVGAQATHAGATADQAAILMIVANELASNAVMHGGGSGRLRLWRGPAFIVCEVVDSGPGIGLPEAVGMRRPPLSSTNGRGLWLVRRMADRVEIDSGPGGTTVAARLALRPRRGVRTGGAHRH